MCDIKQSEIVMNRRFIKPESFDHISCLIIKGSCSVMILDDGIINSKDIMNIKKIGSTLVIDSFNNINIRCTCFMWPIINSPKIANPDIMYKIDIGCRINKITISGSGNLQYISPHFLYETLIIKATGSGDMNIPEKYFKKITIFVSGSGDVAGSNVILYNTEIAHINVSGSGDARGITILDSGMLSKSGSGDIHIMAVNKNNIRCFSSQPGNIRINR